MTGVDTNAIEKESVIERHKLHSQSDASPLLSEHPDEHEYFRSLPSSGQHAVDHVAVDVRQTKIETFESIRQLLVVDAKQVQDGGVKVMLVKLRIHDSTPMP